MPFYDYKCQKCGGVFEVIHGMGEKPAALRCEFCSSAEVERIFHPVGTLKAGTKDFSSTSSSKTCSSCASNSCSTCR